MASLSCKKKYLGECIQLQAQSSFASRPHRPPTAQLSSSKAPFPPPALHQELPLRLPSNFSSLWPLFLPHPPLHPPALSPPLICSLGSGPVKLPVVQSDGDRVQNLITQGLTARTTCWVFFYFFFNSPSSIHPSSSSLLPFSSR